MRRGFTLLELVVVLSLVGVLLSIALPRLDRLHDSITVERAAQEIVSAHQRARILAIARSRSTVLTVGPNQLSIQLRGADTIWSTSGPQAMGVSLSGPPRTMTFSPVGMTMGLSNATFNLTRGSAIRAVVVSRLGRLRIVRQ
jgi:type IV fimbrial biogenesis protein FimT